MAFNRYRTIEHSELEIKEDFEKGQLEQKRLIEFGQKFEQDKRKLEEEFEKIESSNMDSEDKRTILEQLKIALEILQEEYESKVLNPQDTLSKEMEEKIDEEKEIVEEYEEYQKEIFSLDSDSGSLDTSKAADEAGYKADKAREYTQQQASRLKNKMEQQARIQRTMRNSKLSGR